MEKGCRPLLITRPMHMFYAAFCFAHQAVIIQHSRTKDIIIRTLNYESAHHH